LQYIKPSSLFYEETYVKQFKVFFNYLKRFWNQKLKSLKPQLLYFKLLRKHLFTLQTVKVLGSREKCVCVCV